VLLIERMLHMRSASAVWQAVQAARAAHRFLLMLFIHEAQMPLVFAPDKEVRDFLYDTIFSAR